MRKPSLNLTARQTVALSVFGALLAAAGFLLPFPHRNPHNNPGWFLATMLALIIVGFAVSFYASTDLESGLLNDRWPEDEIISTRVFLSSSFFTATAVLSVMAAIIFMWVSRSTRPVGWGLLLFSQSLSRLMAAAKPPRPNRPTSSFTPDWQNFAPLSSDHWGER